MKRLLFIRHGATEGNLQRRYIGRTDEPLCDLGIGQITRWKGKLSTDRLILSPMLRTRQTAQILFPQMQPEIIADFRETDFGIFEGKNYAELSACPAYCAWVESGCTGQIPQGESIADFKRRCCEAFMKTVSTISENSITAFVVHGGVIMAIMEAYAQPKLGFYSYHIQNGEVLSCLLEEDKLYCVKKLPVE